MTRIIGITSAKGGVGKTTLATNLAVALRKLHKKVIVVDCNISTPHLAYYLGVSGYKYTLNDALLDKVDIISAVNNYDGVGYVPASLDLEDLIGIDTAKFKKFISRLAVMNKPDFILLDSAPGLGREALSVLDASNEVIFITTPFAPMINDVIRCVDVMKSLKGVKQLGIVLNMTTNGTYELVGKTISKLTGMPIIGEIPYDRNVVHSLVLKLPITEYKSNSLASIGIMQLAHLVAGENYKLPTKMKMHKLFTRIRNFVLPEGLMMPESVKEVKKDIYIQ